MLNPARAQRDRKAGKDLKKHRLPAAVGIAEISMEHAGDVPAVLHQEGVVEAQLLLKLVHRLLGRAGAQHDAGRVRRGEVEDGEHHEGDRQHDGDEDQDAFDHILDQMESLLSSRVGTKPRGPGPPGAGAGAVSGERGREKRPSLSPRVQIS